MTANRLTPDEIRAYWQGYRHALHDYAWWRDGEEKVGPQYVGCGVRTLKEAVFQCRQRESEELQDIDNWLLGQIAGEHRE